MNDLISRQAAINETWREPRYTDALNALTEIRERIRSLPSAQQWMPVSERLPEEEDMYKRPQNRYFCQMNHAGVFLVLARLRHLDSPMAAFWDWYGKRVPDKDVVAWMPLPEPYKGEES